REGDELHRPEARTESVRQSQIAFALRMETMTRRLVVRLLAALLLPAAAQAAVFAQGEDPVAVAAWERAVRDAGQDQAPAKPPAPPPQQAEGQQSPVEGRGNLREEQEFAPRPGKTTLDPKYRGFIPVPNTPVLFKFNAKPRVDLTMDNQNSGDDTRFVTAK